MVKNTFSSQKLLSFLRYLSFCADILDHVGKPIHNEAKVNFKISDVIFWKTKNYNVHIDQYLKMQSQSDTEIWPVNRM